MEGIQLKVESNNSISVIKVGGYIDTTTSSELEHHLTKLLDQGSYNIVIDLGNVDYVSSAGWGIFISEIKGIREKGGDLKLVGMIPEVYEVFELLEFHYILKAFDSLQDAFKDFEVTGMFAPSTPSVQEPVRSGSIPSQERKAKTFDIGESSAQPDSLEEKVKKIIQEMPQAGTIQIARQLNTPRFGNQRVGWFGMRRLLKQLDLDSKSKRLSFAQKS
ncbi:anti-sigma factor antagonist [candidate division KSB1 bacterium]|nr:anti-sigma factor antagonist [candidate division KSB1 bacterium]RQW00657.1 MAG: anti-sigma factor antagonist [candidate division KSB1 bacterium]